MPTGTCIAAKARKYALVSRPSDDGARDESRTSSGEMTALTVRYSTTGGSRREREVDVDEMQNAIRDVYAEPSVLDDR